MKLMSRSGLLIILVAVGCNSSSTPPGAKNAGDKNGPSFPPNAVVAGRHFAVPPEEWGAPDTIGGVKAFKVKGDDGMVRVDIFTASSPDLRQTTAQVDRFKSMIEPATAVKVDEFQVLDMPVSRVTGAGTRLTFKVGDSKEVGSRYENEGLIGVVFGKPDAQLLIMVTGKPKDVQAFAPKLESWVKSFKAN